MTKSEKITPITMLHRKEAGEKITMLTAYDVGTARLLNDVQIDCVLVGDSLGNVFAGHDSTLPVTLEDMIYHCKAVRRGLSTALLIADMPFMSYHVSVEQAKENAGRLIQEGGAGAVKLEVSEAQLPIVKAVVEMGIPVMGHVGFTPQRVHEIGGYKVQGKGDDAAEKLLNLSQLLEQYGAFSVLLEMVPRDVSKSITSALSIPTIGIGAGLHCDGQVLVTQDLLGLSGEFTPKFVKQYAQLGQIATDALLAFKTDVDTGKFPDYDHSF